jgi:hypothetical protein
MYTKLKLASYIVENLNALVYFTKKNIIIYAHSK